MRINLGDLVTLLLHSGDSEKAQPIMERYGIDEADLDLIAAALAEGRWRVIAHEKARAKAYA